MAKGDRYSRLDGLAGLGFLVNALDSRRNPGGDGDTGTIFPRSDAEDLSRGARFIPGEVTVARRNGERVQFVVQCEMSTSCWYWEMPDGSRIYHYDPVESSALKKKHRGKCPGCGNTNVSGGTIRP